MKYFELTEDHIKLLGAANWRWEDCEFGAPAIDCKRPFGNSGDWQVLLDIDEVLNYRWSNAYKGKNWEFDDADQAEILGLYKELEYALEVVFGAKSLEPGVYENTTKWPHRRVWQKAA